MSGKTFFCQNKKRGCFHLQDSALFRYLAVTTHIQITMGKSTHFIGQYREPDTDSGAEAAGAEMELLGTDHNGQNSADVLCGFLQLV